MGLRAVPVTLRSITAPLWSISTALKGVPVKSAAIAANTGRPARASGPLWSMPARHAEAAGDRRLVSVTCSPDPALPSR
jgi:hypothetical protein